MLATIAQWFMGISLGTFFLHFFSLAIFMRPQDLKKKYKTEWALVTGSSSGIGKALADKLLSQGLNVVVVALDDKLLAETHKELSKKYANLEVRRVGCDLSRPGYMEHIIKATNDIDVGIVFNNAGYVTTGFFADVSLERHLCNNECNSTCALAITHHFLNKMLDSGSKGLIGFTSSPAGQMPSPLVCIYGATKAYITEFALSLAPEVRYFGVDVVVAHPSPVQTRFYASAHNIGSINVFKATASGPENIVNYMFSAAGRTVVADQGYFSFGLALLLKIVDPWLLADIITRAIHLSGDFYKVAVFRKTKTK